MYTNIHTQTESQPTTLCKAAGTFLQGLFIAVGILALLLLPSLSSAADSPDGPYVRAKGGIAARSDFKDDGSYKSETAGFDAGWKWFYLEYTHTSYHWKDYKGMRFSRGHKPWRDLDLIKLGGRVDGQIDGVDRLGWFWDGGLTMGWEDEMRSSFGLAGSGGVTYQFTPELTGKVGIWAMVHPALIRFLPVASLDWNKAGDPGASATLGFPETMFRYRMEQGVTFRAGAKADLGDDTYRLADDSHVYRKGYISSTGLTTGAYVDISPLPGLTATVGLEYDIERKYEIRSNNGNKKQTLDVENTPSLQFSLGYRF